MALYEESGRRRILPPLVFGLGVLWHLLPHGSRYDVVHTASYPYISLLAAAAVRRGTAVDHAAMTVSLTPRPPRPGSSRSIWPRPPS